MIAVDEAALRCDFLETYHVMDYRALPARQAALFACGLGPRSRIRQKLSGSPVPLDTALLALIADAVQILVWQRSEDGVNNRNRPKSILRALTGDEAGTGSVGFDSPEDFEAWRRQMIGGDNDA